MKLLQVINNLGTGGAEKLLFDSIPKYIDRGIATDVLLLNGTEYPFYVELQKKSIAKVFSLGKGSVYNPMHIFRIIKYLKKYDIVHVHLFPGLYWVAIAKMVSFSSVKLVYTEHSTGNRRNNNMLFALLDKLIYAQYDKIICVTKEVELHLKNKLHPPATKLIVIENGIDLSKIENAKPYELEELQLSLPTNAKLLIQVSSFQSPKDQMTVIKSLLQLPENIHLLLAGGGILMEECKLFTEQLHLTQRVHFLGIRMDVPQLLKTADIIILSSGFEGLSLSCIEGLASGKPFIASDVRGLNEMVKDVGLLFPFQDDLALAEIIHELLSNKEKYDTVAQNGKVKASQYSSSNMIEKHVDAYVSLNNKS